MKTSILIAMILAIGGCKVEPRNPHWVREYKLNVNCGELFKGDVYQLKLIDGGFYTIPYETEDGTRIEFPRGDCVVKIIDDYTDAAD